MLYVPERHPIAERRGEGGLMITRPWMVLFEQITQILGLIITPGGIAPSDAEYLVAATNAILTAERLIQDTATITWDFSVPGIGKANAALTNIVRRGLRSAQPAAGTVDAGTLYFVTDEEVIERSNGLIWQTYSTATATAGITEISITGDIMAGAAAYHGFVGRSKLSSPTDGTIALLNAAASAFTALLFGGSTSAFPALKRSSAVLQVKLADDSAFAQIEALDAIVQAANRFGWSGRARMTSPADSQILLTNNAASDFARLMFGGTAATFPALKRSTTFLQVRLADDSGYGGMDAGSYSVGGVAGASGTGTSVTAVNGIVTAISGSANTNYAPILMLMGA